MNFENFEVSAFFYNGNNNKNGFRRYLEIKRKNTAVTENDLNIIMMNPGSSNPKNSNLEYLNRLVEANPDTTQYQIMRVMDKCNLDFVKAINLSDIRESKSQFFYKFLETELSENYPIFSDINEDVLNNYLNPKSIFVFA